MNITMSISISMLIGGILLGLGTLLVVISWFEIGSASLSTVIVIYVTGFFTLMVGLMFAFMRNISKKQV